MKYNLKSLEWLEGSIEKLQLQSTSKNQEEEDIQEDAENDESVSLLLEWKMRISTDSDKCTTCECDIDFDDRNAIVEHYKSAWHRTNLRRKNLKISVMNEEEFENYDENDEQLLTSKPSENESEDEEQEIDECLLPSGRSFFVHNKNVFSVSKAILHVDEKNVSFSTFTRPFDCVIILFNGGHFAAGVFENDRLVLHKSFHRYVARAKQGGVQSQYDSSHGNAKSAGAALRRYNEAKMKEEIQQIMRSWKEKLLKTRLIFIRCASYQKAVFFDAEAGILRGDERIRSVPFETKRPNIEEIHATWNRLQWVEEHGELNEFREQMSALNERKKKVQQKFEKKARKQFGDWDEKKEKERKKREEERKTDHVKVRVVEQKIDRWPELNDEWRKQAYNLIRLDDVDGIRKHIQTINEMHREQVMDYLRNARFSPNSSTFLHIVAAKELLNMLKFLLNEISCDPTSKDETGRPPYSLSASKQTKNVFIDFRVENPEKYTWTRTHIPEPAKPVILSVEEELRQSEKKKEKKMKQKENAKIRKEEEKKEEQERIERERWAKLSEREKRAEACERRLAGLPPISRCQQCGLVLAADSPSFQYSHFKFCSTQCVALHRKNNP
ncbi:unnamed protein product [Caenorhabditis angaria]|uniref:VLRF1 domain-containing protein n=1 Tax=Caenorhabditis angaria TaxID=860376 RepID=A0A9P1IIZ0_9PELO|nr:unnamed protein product [Caenorhabditis angaria]